MTYLTKGATHRPPIIETLFENTHVKIDRVTAQGQITGVGDFPNEPSNEFIHVLKGNLVLQFQGEKGKVSLKAGDYAVKGPTQRTRADFTALKEETVWLKISYKGNVGRYPEFTGAVGPEEVRAKGRK